MKQLLSLKHWQLFLVYFIIFIPFDSIKPILLGITSFVHFFWVISIVILGRKQINRENLSLTNVKLFFIALFLIPILAGLQIIVFTGKNVDIEESVFTVIAFVLLVFSTIFCGFYVYFVAARTISILEKKREVKFEDWNKNFLFVGCPLIGVWFIQPKLCELGVTNPVNNANS